MSGVDDHHHRALMEPGRGWSNGDIHPQLYPDTREGKLELYSSQRRWIHLAHGWSRVGGGGGDGNDNGDENGTGDEYAHRTSVSHQGSSVIDVHDKEGEALSVRSLIAQLCEQFYRNGWATGTGGGISIRVGGPSENLPWRVFVAPSGIQKEDMVGDDIFELDMDRNVVIPPRTNGLRQSACTPLWYVVYRNRPSARAVIHTHSMYAQLATLLDPTETTTVFRITHLEMIKGVGHHAYDDVLEVPIIDNRPSEDMLAEQLERAVQAYPKCNCVLVRRHGLYVWGDSWEQAKTQCESFDYLFQSAIEMKKLGIDCSLLPQHGTYGRDDEEQLLPKAKRPRANNETATTTTTTTTTHDGWNGSMMVDNAKDLASNVLPLLPRDYKHLLLDIEGCTTAISFVKDTLFPYVLEHVDTYLTTLSSPEVHELVVALRSDLTQSQREEVSIEVGTATTTDVRTECSAMVRYMVKNDLKVASLKSLQGQMWKDGYENGNLKGHVYSDFIPMLEWMKSHNVHVYIYSSGSIQAQKLLFGHSIYGNLLHYISGHYDITTAGNKKDDTSYTKICSDLHIQPSQLVFCSDAEAELDAAQKAGIGCTVMTIRPGNVPLTSKGQKAYPLAHSLLQLCGV